MLRKFTQQYSGKAALVLTLAIFTLAASLGIRIFRAELIAQQPNCPQPNTICESEFSENSTNCPNDCPQKQCFECSNPGINGECTESTVDYWDACAMSDRNMCESNCKTCGNAICQSEFNENSDTCPVDCPTKTCFDCSNPGINGECSSREADYWEACAMSDIEMCKSSCISCPNAVCDQEQGENSDTCPVDCPKKECSDCVNGSCQMVAVDYWDTCVYADLDQCTEATGCAASAPAQSCGNGIVEGSEQCDEGDNNVDPQATIDFNEQAEEGETPFAVDPEVIQELQKSGCLTDCTFAQCSDTDDNDTDEKEDNDDPGCYTCSTCFKQNPDSERGGPNWLPGKNDEVHICGEEIPIDGQLAYESSNATPIIYANLLAAGETPKNCKVKTPRDCSDFTDDKSAHEWAKVLLGRFNTLMASVCAVCQWDACPNKDPRLIQDAPDCPGKLFTNPIDPDHTFNSKYAMNLLKQLATVIDRLDSCPCEPQQEFCGKNRGANVCCAVNMCRKKYDQACSRKCYTEYKDALDKCYKDSNTQNEYKECKDKAKLAREKCDEKCVSGVAAACGRSNANAGGGDEDEGNDDNDGCDVRFRPQCLCDQQPGCAAEFCRGNIFVCEDGDQCTQDYCNSGTGQCENRPWVVPMQGCSQGGPGGNTGGNTGNSGGATGTSGGGGTSTAASSEEASTGVGPPISSAASVKSAGDDSSTQSEESSEQSSETAISGGGSSQLAFSSAESSASEDANSESAVSVSSLVFSFPEESSVSSFAFESSEIASVFSSEITEDDDGDATSSTASQIAAAFCGDGIIQTELGEDCDLGLENGVPGSAAGCSCDPETPGCSSPIPGLVWSACRWPRCGDGLVNNEMELQGRLVNFDLIPEQCDDGNNTPGDGCNPVCQLEQIASDTISSENSGDTGTFGTEDDEGDRVSSSPVSRSTEPTSPTVSEPDQDTVQPTLAVASSTAQTSETLVAAASVCGNGVIEPSEECDDANRRDDDGCSTQCQLEIGICGDGIVQKLLGEQCEQASHNSTLPYSCVRCQFVSDSCGNGIVDPGEECDEGQANSVSPDANCRPSCRLSTCGDNVLDTNESCDDGNRVSGDGCDRNCRQEQTETPPTQVASENTDVPFNAPPSTNPPANVQFPMQPSVQALPFQLPLAQLQPLIQTQAPVGDTGPAAVAVIGAGAAAGWSWMRRKKK